jgi:hypothetical protein
MPQNDTLDAIGLKHGTDKSSLHHDYLEFYETFFAPLRDKSISLLEIGVFEGASLRTWKEYFVNAKIVGADIASATKRFEGDRVSIELLDQSNIEELTRAAVKHGPFDIVIEDGSHMWEHQITSLRTLFPFLRQDGIYIVEDLQTNYGALKGQFKGIASSSCVDYIKTLVDLRVADNQIPIEKVEDAFLRTYGRAIHFITFYRRACLIKKRFPPVSREISAGQPLVTLPPEESSVSVNVLAHVSHRGDLLGRSGFINLGADRFSFQGLNIETGERLLEYRVRWPDQTWSPWCEGNRFVGTRGQAKLLTGFTIRLTETARDRHVLRAFGRFAGSSEPIEVANEQDCVSGAGEALCGIQIALKPSTPET